MKKVFFFISILILNSSIKSSAQSANLTIVNHNQTCTLYVDMFAYDANLGNYNCDIRSYSIMVLPLTTYGPYNPSYVYGTPGFVTMTTYFTAAALATDLASLSPGWVWTDASFQYSCTSADCGTGGRLSESFPVSCPNNCLSAGLTWSYGGLCSPISHATWSSPGNCLMNDVKLDFY